MTAPRYHPRLLPLLGLWLVMSFAPAAATAQTIYWGSAANDFLFDSTGAPLDDSYTFELGTFGVFLPDDTNLDQWQTHWKVLDRAVAPAASGWNAADGFFSGTVTLQADGSSSRGPDLGTSFTFNPGEQAYIWVFNSPAMATGTEWSLVTNDSSDGLAADDWLIPALPDPCGCSSGADSLEWRLSTASQPDFGGLNEEYGPGNVSSTPPTYSLQTATLPEPAGILLLLTAASLLHLPRSRR
jgi:hypothetical protein